VYERIILPVDGTKRALAPLAVAEELAATWGCPLEVLHVITRDELPSQAEPAGYDVRRLEGPDPAAVRRQVS
jgi:nucleotide-binding universal stress UspA family protein